MLLFDAFVAIQQYGDAIGREMSVTELECMVVKSGVHPCAFVDVCHQMVAIEKCEEDASGFFDNDAHAGHDSNIFVCLHFHSRTSNNHV